MKRLKVAVAISGGGSNLQALIDACSAPGFPAEIVRVVSNRPGVKGLDRAAAAGIPATVVDHKAFADRESFDAALHEALVDGGAVKPIVDSVFPFGRAADAHRKLESKTALGKVVVQVAG